MTKSFAITIEGTPAKIKSISAELKKNFSDKDVIRITALFENKDQAYVELGYKELDRQAAIYVLTDYKAFLATPCRAQIPLTRHPFMKTVHWV